MKILHAADLHLDSPFQALGREKAALRRSEQRLLLSRMVELAKEEKVDLVLFAGDLLDTDVPYPETSRLLESVLSAFEVPVFIAPGNHDWYGPHSPWARMHLSGNVHIFQTEEIQYVDVPEQNARVWGSAFTGKYRTAPLAGFEAEKAENRLDILLLHGEVGVPGSLYGAISEQDIARSGMDYIALGHIHTCSGLRRAGETYYAWPGCPEGRGFDETGEKGVLLVEMEVDKCTINRKTLGGRRYEVLNVKCTNSENPIQTIERALDRDTERDIYRIVLRGELDTPPDTLAIRSALNSRFFSLEIQDRTTIQKDIWQEREVMSLRGLFLDGLWKRYQEADEAERTEIEMAVRFGLQALEGGEEPPLP